MYESVLVQMVADCESHLHTDQETRHIATITRRLAFYEGYAARIGERLLRARATTQADLAEQAEPDVSESTALAVKAKEVEVSDYFAEILRRQNIRGSWKGGRRSSWFNAPQSYAAGDSAASRARLGDQRALGA